MLKRLRGLLVVLVALAPGGLVAKQDKVPADFKLVYRSSAGQIEQATQEQVEVSEGQVTVTRRAKSLGSSAMADESRSYKVDSAQLTALWTIVRESGFLTWNRNPEAPHQSQVEESFEVVANGKTYSHGRWEEGHRESFRALFEKYNAWFNGIRTVRF